MADKYYLRKVRMTDINDVFHLSNEDYVRKYSINKSKINWSEHVKWFKKNIDSENYVFYVISDDKDNFLGQIRYEIDNIYATVSISLSKSLKGQGLGSKLLKKSLSQLKNDRSEIEYILAFVSNSNVASKKVFEKTNFLLRKENINLQMREYILQINKGDLTCI